MFWWIWKLQDLWCHHKHHSTLKPILLIASLESCVASKWNLSKVLEQLHPNKLFLGLFQRQETSYKLVNVLVFSKWYLLFLEVVTYFIFSVYFSKRVKNGKLIIIEFSLIVVVWLNSKRIKFKTLNFLPVHGKCFLKILPMMIFFS